MPRREERKPLVMSATCRFARTRCQVVLTNLSTKGCKLMAIGLSLSIGQSVKIRPEGLEGLLGTVRWVGPDCAGVEFDYPLHPAVMDHLCHTHPGSD